MRSNQLSYPAIAESECKDKRKKSTVQNISRKNRRKNARTPSGTDFDPPGKQTFHVMRLKKITRDRLSGILGSVNVAGGLVLLAAMSREILGGNHALFLAFYLVIRWLAGDRVRKLLAAYVLTVALFTYLSALVFYDYEAGVNPGVHGFGDAVWWAWMNVTTVGAEIFPVTSVGRVFSVLLPSLGMLFFPIFTTYVLQEYAPTKKSGD